MSKLPFIWDDLQFFLAVARHGQLSRAARQMRTSHVTVARRVERLESALNARLFERTPRGYDLTAAGLRLMEQAEKLEQETDKLREQIAGPGFDHRGVVRLNMPEGFSHFFCSALLEEFGRAFPAATLELVSIQQILSLSRKVSDIAVMLDPPKAGPYWSQKITDYSLHLYATQAYLDRAPAIHCREDLIQHPFIGYIDEMIFAPGLDYLDDVHNRIRTRFQSSSIFTQQDAIRTGLGVGVLPFYVGSKDPLLVHVLPEEVELRRSYWIACHRDLKGAPKERAVIDFITRAVAAQRHRLLRPMVSPAGESSAKEA